MMMVYRSVVNAWMVMWLLLIVKEKKEYSFTPQTTLFVLDFLDYKQNIEAILYYFTLIFVLAWVYSFFVSIEEQ